MCLMLRLIFPLLVLLLSDSVSSLVRRGSGVVMVRISSISNPEGRDAAGTCCNGGSEVPGSGVCSGNCYSMMRVCASQIRNDSVLLEMVNIYKNKKQTEILDREVQGRIPDIQIQPDRIGPNLSRPLGSSNRATIRIKPQKNFKRPQQTSIKKTRPRRPPLPKSTPKFPFGPLPNLFRSRSGARPPKLESRTSLSWGDRELESVWQPEEFTVMWRDSRGVQSDGERDRAGKILFGDNVTCKYGALNTGVIFNNSLGGRQRDLLIKLPFEEAWPGMFEFTLEVWHNANPTKIPHPSAQSKKANDGERGILETLFDTLATQLTKTVTDFEAKKLEDLLGENDFDLKVSDNETEQASDVDTTTISSAEEITTIVEPMQKTKELVEEAPKKDRLIVRLEKDHMIYAGDDWQSSSYTGYHATVSYSVKLACSKEFTGPTCSFAKLCLAKAGAQPRHVCTKEGEMVCRPGWAGPTCERPVCAPGCDARYGFCDKPGECKCKVGWHGPRCDKCDKLLGCSRNGFCEKPFECHCQSGWKGLFCTEPVCREGCQELQGYCNRPGECRCRPGWTGASCDTCVPLSGCVHGTCSRPGECECEPGWRGPGCDQAECAPGCHPEHGECGAPGECRCRLGWQGQGCGQCVQYPGCVNGQCHEAWTCHCQAGWAGEKCDEIETEEFGPGVRDGRCQEDGAFLCMNGGVDVCSWSGNGTLVERPRCKCQPGFSGKFCQDSLSRGQDTVHRVLPVQENYVEELPAKEIFPSKLGNALEKL